MKRVPQFSIDVALNAAKNFENNESRRKKNLKAVKSKKIDKAETKERMAKRVNHLVQKARQHMLQPGIEKFMPRKLAELAQAPPISADEIDNLTFERVLGESRDFLGVEFLSLASWAVRPVGLITTQLPDGRVGLGTGFLVSRHLLLTNHHVLENEDDAKRSKFELDFQRGEDGGILPSRKFSLNPSMFFLANKRLDFALVGVNGADERADDEFLPLNGAEGKISIGERINIIQHPRGRLKEVVIRDNPLLDLPITPDFVAHYKADTESGSSGSPVFNDDWEVVALHHSGVPKRNGNGDVIDINGDVWDREDPEQIQWVANEGIRISRIIDFVKKSSLSSDSQNQLRDELLENTHFESHPPKPHSTPPTHPVQVASVPPRTTSAVAPSGTISMSIPLNITISLGDPNQPSNLTHDSFGFAEAATTSELNQRAGYDPDFLGVHVPMPEPNQSVKHLAFFEPDSSSIELKYTNFSVIMNRERRLAFVSAGNVDFNANFRHTGSLSFKQDPRVPPEFEANNKFYKHNPLDRGHLFRKAAGAWGASPAEAKQAATDTYYYTNIAPQHSEFNKSSEGGMWGLLENHIASQSVNNGQTYNVYNGPVFRESDRLHRGLKIPSEFWKVVVYFGDSGQLKAAGFLLTQKEKISDLAKEAFAFDGFELQQRSITEIESLTHLDFGAMKSMDVIQGEESPSENESFAIKSKAITSFQDIVI